MASINVYKSKHVEEREERTIRISDLNITACLMTLGHEPINTLREGRSVFWIFSYESEVEEIINDYQNNKLIKIDLKLFVDNNKDLRSIINNCKIQ